MALPYSIDISDDRLDAIKAKVEGYDWSQLPDAGGWTLGVGVNDLKRIACWRDAYDWRKVEHRLNQLPKILTSPNDWGGQVTEVPVSRAMHANRGTPPIEMIPPTQVTTRAFEE